MINGTYKPIILFTRVSRSTEEIKRPKEILQLLELNLRNYSPFSESNPGYR